VPTDHRNLFLGACIQWALAIAVTRYAVLDGPWKLALGTFLAQSIWWVNIQQTTRDGKWTRWLAWSSGAAFGAACGQWITGGL
jgi:hypothetical protein